MGRPAPLKAHAQMMEAIIDHPGGYRRGGVGVFSEHPLFEHLPVENMVFSNQQAYYDAITASSQAADSGVFIDFMLSEILATLKNLTSAGLLSRAGGNKYGKWIAGRSGMRKPHGGKSGH